MIKTTEDNEVSDISDLIHVRGNTYYIKGSINCGIVVNGSRECVLIDSGLDERYSNRILKALAEKDWRLQAVINTHSHADHCGGNALLQKKTAASFYASSFEAAVIENPILEPYYLFSAAPPPELQGKFLKAAPTTDVITIDAGMKEIGGSLLRILPLPGHSAEQLGVITTDGILFVGDSVFPAQVWEKYKIPYFENIANALNTLTLLKDITCDGYVVAHFGFVEEISKMAQWNIQGIYDIMQRIQGLLQEPLTREEILHRLIMNEDINVSVVQYYLLSSCISAFLTYLTEKEHIEAAVDRGRLIWQRT